MDIQKSQDRETEPRGRIQEGEENIRNSQPAGDQELDASMELQWTQALGLIYLVEQAIESSLAIM